MKTVYERPKIFTDAITTYCGGCGHGIVNRLIAELIDEMGLQRNGIIVWPIGCSCLADKYNVIGVTNGEEALAKAINLLPNLIITDLMMPKMNGIAEIMHAAIRGEKFSVIFINNAIYGMTGGQIAPTTLMDQKATTAPTGRKAVNSGYPINMAETLATLQGVCYSERVTVTTPQNVMKAKKAIKKAFDLQMAGKGMTFVEVLSPCPTNWGMQPIKAMEWINEVMVEQYPLGVFKDEEDEAV